MKYLLKNNGITHSRTIPLQSQANGQVQRINPLVKKAIQAVINEGCNWKHKLDAFLLSYRDTPHCMTGETHLSFVFQRPLGTSYQLFQVLKISQDTVKRKMMQ